MGVKDDENDENHKKHQKVTNLLELLVVLCLGRVVHAAGVPLGVPRAPQVHEVRPEEHQLLVISDK